MACSRYSESAGQYYGCLYFEMSRLRHATIASDQYILYLGDGV